MALVTSASGLVMVDMVSHTDINTKQNTPKSEHVA